MNQEEKIQRLSLIEQNLNNSLMQKQNFQMQEIEIDNALKELKDSKEAYQIVGNIMIKAEGTKLKKELESKKEIIELRIKNIEKQEEKIKSEAENLQKEVMKNMKNE